jgi:hypothetical protein
VRHDRRATSAEEPLAGSNHLVGDLQVRLGGGHEPGHLEGMEAWVERGEDRAQPGQGLVGVELPAGQSQLVGRLEGVQNPFITRCRTRESLISSVAATAATVSELCSCSARSEVTWLSHDRAASGDPSVTLTPPWRSSTFRSGGGEDCGGRPGARAEGIAQRQQILLVADTVGGEDFSQRHAHRLRVVWSTCGPGIGSLKRRPASLRC